jgi:hypothetical protein
MGVHRITKAKLILKTRATGSVYNLIRRTYGRHTTATQDHHIVHLHRRQKANGCHDGKLNAQDNTSITI